MRREKNREGSRAPKVAGLAVTPCHVLWVEKGNRAVKGLQRRNADYGPMRESGEDADIPEIEE